MVKLEFSKLLSSVRFRYPAPIFMLKAPDHIKEERMNICKTCEHFTGLQRCKKCGCFMPAKVLLARTKCPLDKWSYYEEKK